MSSIVIWLVIWLVLGLLVGALASLVTKAQPPYGQVVDIIAAVLTMILVGLGDYFVLPMVGIRGALAFATMVLEPFISTVLVLWLLRIIKRRQAGA
ncbi:MAG: hypothetical protein JW850_16720 [Thermoflexales bacterium]|nr:hypothetical protein [Thermoflexales bacterium]